MPPTPAKKVKLSSTASSSGSTPSLPSPELVEAALQPHVVDAVVRFALKKVFPDAARIALVSRVWAQGVRGWMVTPRLEGTERDRYCDELIEKWTGLPAALGYHEIFKSSGDATALLALLRAATRPAADAVKLLRKGFNYDEDRGDFFYSLSFSAFKLEGVPDTTFVWGDYSWGVDDTNHLNVLYFLEGQNRRFRLLLDVTHGAQAAEDCEIHLPRFLALRARLCTAIPALAHTPDALLMALLCAVGGGDSFTLEYLTGCFAFTRLMDNHPEIGDGRATEAERKLGKLDNREEGFLPNDVGTGYYGDDVLPSDPHDYYELGWGDVQGLCYPELSSRALTSIMTKTVALLEAFHRGT